MISTPANKYYITASLTTTPMVVFPGDGQQLLPSSSLIVPVLNGIAEFTGLYINKTGYPYQITFSINKVNIFNIFILSTLLFIIYYYLFSLVFLA